MKMKLVLTAIAGCAALGLAIPSFGQAYYGPYTGPALSNGEPVTLQYYPGDYSGGANFAGNGAGIYTGELTAGFNQPILTGSGPNNAGIVCDDNNDLLVAGKIWDANAYQASTIASNITETLFGSTIGVQGYAEVATLVSFMFSGGTTYGSITGITQTEISDAIWALSNTLTIPMPQVTTEETIAQELVNAVFAVYGNKSNSGTLAAATTYLNGLTNLWVLTPNNAANAPGNLTGQEVWLQVPAPEGGSALLYLLLAGFTCFGAMRFNSRLQFGNRIA